MKCRHKIIYLATIHIPNQSFDWYVDHGKHNWKKQKMATHLRVEVMSMMDKRLLESYKHKKFLEREEEWGFLDLWPSNWTWLTIKDRNMGIGKGKCKGGKDGRWTNNMGKHPLMDNLRRLKHNKGMLIWDGHMIGHMKPWIHLGIHTN